MKKLSLTMIAVFFLVCSVGVQAQTTQTPLNQRELMKQFLGTWQANAGKDTVEVWDYQQYGKAYIINVSHIIKGQKTPLYINNVGFDPKADKFKGYVLWPDGTYSTWIGYSVTEKKFLVSLVDSFNPDVVWYKWESVTLNPKEFNWTGYNADGVKGPELKFIKIK